MRIVFFGSPAAALPSLERLLGAGHDVPLVVTQPDKPAGRGRKLTPCPVKRFALDRGLPVLEPVRIRKDETAPGILKAAAPDIQVVVAYGQILPVPIIDFPPLRTVNVHFSLLPKYRGASPVAWAILNGETTTGVTIFRLNEKMDEGDVYSSRAVIIGPAETAGELESRLAELGAGLLIEILDGIHERPLAPQDHARATPAPKLAKEDGRVDWAREAADIDRRVRAFNPRPGAFTFLAGRRLLVRRGSPLERTSTPSTPGRVLALTGEGMEISCGGSVYLIHALQPEGRRIMEATAFAAGGGVGVGDVLG
jgi:methionyl-tRNA formyltransferase